MDRRNFLGGGLASLLLTTPIIAQTDREQFPDRVTAGPEHLAQRMDDAAEGGTNESRAEKFLARNKDTINTLADRYQVPVQFFAAVTYIEHQSSSKREQKNEELYVTLGMDPSCGPIEMKISTAAKVDGKDPEKITRKERKEYYTKLNNETTNLDYTARYLQKLITKSKSDDIMDTLALAATRYTFPESTSKANWYGATILEYMKREPVTTLFGRSEKEELIQPYLDLNEIYIKKTGREYAEQEKSNAERMLIFFVGGVFVAGMLGLGAAMHTYNVSKKMYQEKKETGKITKVGFFKALKDFSY